MDLAALHIFKTVVEQGGINKAAAKLNRVPSNVTTRVKQLEEELGTKLFLREGRGLVVSPEGRVLLGYADQLLKLSAEAEAALRKGVPRGTLKLGALESLATSPHRLPPLLSRYHRLYPDVQVELVTGTSSALVGKVRQREIDAALVPEPSNLAQIEVQTVYLEELVLITPKIFPRVRTPKDLDDHKLTAFTTGCASRRSLLSWLERGKFSPERVKEYQSYDSVIACVSEGEGIAMVPRTVLEAARGSTEFATHPLPKEIARARTQLVWRVGHQLSALDALKKLVSDRALKSAA
jgi:DNA-binding transcriptional LysR family regulator